MDEMTLLEDMCAAVPPPDAARLAAVRSRVLGDGGPAPERRVWPGRSHRERGRTPLLSRPRLALGGGVAFAVAAAAVVVGGLPIGGVEFAPSADAAQVLRRAAAVALTQPGPRGRQFVYTAIEGSQGVFRSAGTPATVLVQMWQSTDGSRAGTIVAASCVMLTQGDFSYQHRQPPSPCVLAILPDKHLPAAASYAGLRTLPTRPRALLAYIDAHFKPTPFPGETRARVRWDALQTILRDDVAVPPKLAAAIFTAAASLPGTVLLRHVVDAAGRPGIAVTMQQYGLSSELIFNPRTYRFTGSADVVTSRGSDTSIYPIGTIYFAMALLRTEFTSTAPAGPGNDVNVYQPEIIGEFSH